MKNSEASHDEFARTICDGFVSIIREGPVTIIDHDDDILSHNTSTPALFDQKILEIFKAGPIRTPYLLTLRHIVKHPFLIWIICKCVRELIEVGCSDDDPDHTKGKDELHLLITHHRRIPSLSSNFSNFLYSRNFYLSTLSQ